MHQNLLLFTREEWQQNLQESAQDNVYFIQRNVVNLFFIYDLNTQSRDLNMVFKLRNCLFGAIKLPENPDPDKYGYSDYGI